MEYIGKFENKEKLAGEILNNLNLLLKNSQNSICMNGEKKSEKQSEL